MMQKLRRIGGPCDRWDIELSEDASFLFVPLPSEPNNDPDPGMAPSVRTVRYRREKFINRETHERLTVLVADGVTADQAGRLLFGRP